VTPRSAFRPDGWRIACEIRVQTGTAISLLDTDSGKGGLSLPVPAGLLSQATFLNRVTDGSLNFNHDGHRLHLFARGSNWPGGKAAAKVQETYLRMRTWDASPLPEAKGP
jgi:hypothetical protein